ncbi:neuraminidase-like domain-containing protein [Photorhabdus sp. RM323S]|uniref:Tc toxin subunit A-related protein n=1 Tax=Photorhabdus sp. RM323S TaxID=3342828 RepID=UPI0036D9FBF2
MSTLTPELLEITPQEQKANRLHEASILKRANPQLQHAVHLAITEPHADQQGYNSKFGGRASQYVAPGAVASMFSPAAYLTELYRQARDLHAESSDYHLDKRRPDLQSLALSQKNMDSEISTLSLSNKVLLEGIKNKLLEHIKTLSKDKLLKDIAPLFKDKLPENIETLFNLDSHTKVMEALPNFRVSGMMPYHDAYERVRKIIQLQAPVFEQVSTSSETTIANLMYQASLLGINASVSPELFNTLTEEITETNANEKFKKNFGDIKLAELLTLDALKYYYNLTNEELEQFLKYILIESNSTYTNNQLINISIDTSGKIQLSRITRTPGSNYNNLNYMNLHPIQNKHFYVDISYKKKAGQVSIRLNSPQSKYLTGIYNNTTLENTNYSSPRFQLAKEDIQKEFILLSYRYKENSHSDISDSSYAKFQIQNYSPAIFLLKLNKTILLSHATKLLPAVLEKIVFGINQELDINAEVLKKVFRVKYYMQRYGIDAETGLILCKAPISKNTHDDHSSQFDRLFNTPKLNGQVFSDKSEEMIDLNPSGTSDWKNTVLKRAFNVDDTSLYRLLKIANRDNSDGRIINNIENLSHLYLAKLLADIHQLTIDELSLLLKTIGEEKTNLSTISHTALETLIDKLYAVISWLRTQKWSVYQLFMMTTTKYDITLTPEIQNLLDTVYNGLQGFNSENEANLLLKMSPYIAAALQLPSENVAHYVLTWADQLKPSAGKVTAGKFLGWLQALRDPKQPKSAVTQEQAVQYCQCLAQLTLIYRSTDLSESTLRLFVTKPQLFGIKAGTAPTHTTLITLTRFADWVNSLGENASSVLTEFEKETLTAEQLAKAMNLDENLLLQASTQAQKDFSLWTSLDTILQWVNIARQLNISPSDVSALMKLQAEKSTYDQWENVATILTAGLNTQQANSLHAFVDESRSAALSEYYIGKVSSQNPAIKNRDDLYQYLLIDNQVSAAIKTTLIAEAIASIQLYINRALKNMEGNAVSQVVNRPFFTDWDKYNKRYSTWASIAKLVYYPENYIDPTMRIGQTKMMDALLQSISQSQLNTDTVENAFMSYLTSFEQVANLEVVSAYHDNTYSDQGLTYFIGHSKTEVNQYYWRSVDHNKFSDGKFPANAWSEWYQIDCPINPYKNIIRPVIFQSRLHLIWLEQKKVVKQAENNNQTVEKDYHYELKLAHIRYDGTWNTPVTFDVSDKISAVLKTLMLLEQLKKYQKQLEETIEGAQRAKEEASRNRDLPLPLIVNPPKPPELLDELIKQLETQLQEEYYLDRLEELKKLIQQEIKQQQKLLQLGFYCTNHQDNKLLVMFYQKQDSWDKYTTEAPIKGLHIFSNMLFEDTNPEDYITHICKQFDTNTEANYIIKVNNQYEISSLAETDDDNILTINHDANGAQYMQWEIHRIRLNTLFAHKLVSRATAGIDTILNIETQNIQEPTLWNDNFTAKLPIYSSDLHGNSRNITIMLGNNIEIPDEKNVIYQGELKDDIKLIDLSETYISVINGSNSTKPGNEQGSSYYWIYLFVKYSDKPINIGGFWFINETDFKCYYPVSYKEDIVPIFTENKLGTEPMDFSGANSLYFWELFYYVPMLIAQRLLHEQNFDEANRWLKYIWNPSGYIENGQIQHYNWNVRPLLEDTSWNDDPLNSIDPDAVAQYDPMHYKVATFMRTLDLLLDRGDYAYRQLERDTLNEAKMWYMQALHLLGDKPHLPLNSTWNDEKSLSDAANPERQKAHSHAIAALRQGESTQVSNQTDLFLPQVNEVMLSYWQKLEQRLYNLRHNLSIDGQLLHLPIYATPADPKALLSAAIANSQGGAALSQPFMSLWRFPHMLENARGMVSQLTQFGSTLQNIIERQDAEALNVLLQNQAKELILTNISIQNKTIEELDAEKTVLEKTRLGTQSRFNSYSKLYDENVNAGEHQALDMRVASHSITSGLKSLHMAAAALDMVPNIYGLAVGGSHYGAIANAIAIGGGIAADGLLIEADKVSQSEIWRRRRQEWEIQRNNAQTELNQIDAQLGSLAVRREAAVLQKTSLKTQQEQTQAQLTFLQRKFSNQALYNWLRGRLAAIYFQFYDLAVSRCLMAEMAYCWETNETTTSFIKPGAWQGTHAGLLAGENLMLNLAQMEDAHLRWDKRALEVERTVSLADVYTELGKDRIDLAAEITDLLKKKKDNLGNDNNSIRLNDNKLIATVNLANLNIREDYPASVGETRRIKQISVTLPALLGPYQDVQAILSYGGSETRLAESCKSLAVSHGMSDSGQFQLDFNNGKFLPFEGIAVDDKGTLILSFPNATDKQQAMLQTLSDIILHIRYTIR